MQIYPNITIICLATAVCFTLDAAGGEGGAVLPSNPQLSDYVRVGLLNHPGLRSDYEKYKAALQRVPQVKSLPEPMMGYTHFFEQVQTRTGPQENVFTVSQTIPWMGKLRHKGTIASREAEAALRQYEQRRLQIIRDISVAYYDYAYLGKESAIIRKTLELLGQLEESVKEKVRVGGDYSASLRLEVEKGKTEDQLKTLGRERARKSAVLQALLGSEPGGEMIRWPSLTARMVSPPSRATLRKRILRGNPRLKAIEEKIIAAEERVRLAKKSSIPDPTIGMNYVQIGGSGDDAVGMTVGFRIPLSFRKYKAERLEAEAEQRAMRDRLAEEENKLIEALAVAMADYEEAADRLGLYRDKLLPAAEEAVKVGETSYASGKAGILEVIDSERTLLELKKIYWRAVADMYSSVIELQTLTGTEK